MLGLIGDLVVDRLPRVLKVGCSILFVGSKTEQFIPVGLWKTFTVKC